MFLKKVVALMSLVAVLAVSGQALAIVPELGLVSDADFQNAYNDAQAVSHNTAWENPFLGPNGEEMEKAYRDGTSVQPGVAFNPILGPAVNDQAAGF
jgi:hypothetical protein